MENNVITMSIYLAPKKDKKIKAILENCSLGSVSIDLFFKVFEGRVERTMESVVEFITNPDNAYELSIFGNRATGENKFNAYNGKSNYQGVNCTLGASHSRYHG